jgi:hypothetical protein
VRNHTIKRRDSQQKYAEIWRITRHALGTQLIDLADQLIDFADGNSVAIRKFTIAMPCRRSEARAYEDDLSLPTEMVLWAA